MDYFQETLFGYDLRLSSLYIRIDSIKKNMVTNHIEEFVPSVSIDAKSVEEVIKKNIRRFLLVRGCILWCWEKKVINFDNEPSINNVVHEVNAQKT